MKRHKRKQKQWSKKAMPTLICATSLAHTTPPFPELSIISQMMEDTEISELIKEDKP